ncbi:SDR family NAD(P)-dependent oxidoreductase, partial [Phytoactinopolyspora endophytica]|uniref:SDR family NAD(P)-dependent oxidoreductase n=1 Tax=Phytoactinopolyspora endophytica TaxID=1642495 RepID=UPI00101C9704
MLLENKITVIYGAGGSVGGAAARAFAREGARVFLAGRTRSTLEIVAKDISESGSSADVAEVDALDEQAVGEHVDAVVARTGRLDVSFNAVGMDNGDQGIPLVELSADAYVRPVNEYLRAQFVTAKAAVRQ